MTGKLETAETATCGQYERMEIGHIRCRGCKQEYKTHEIWHNKCWRKNHRAIRV